MHGSQSDRRSYRLMMFQNMIHVCVSIFFHLELKMSKNRVKVPRKRQPISFWRTVKSLKRDGKTRRQIEEELGVAITKTAFFGNVKKDFDKSQVKSRKFNLTHKKTDSPVYKRFELEVVKYFNKKNRTGCFGFQFIGLSAEEVRKRNEFKDVEILKNLEFSLNWTRRVAKNNNLLWTSRKEYN